MAASPCPMPAVSTMTRCRRHALLHRRWRRRAPPRAAPGLARRERAHEHVRAVNRVHADAVAEQRTAGLATRRINGKHRAILSCCRPDPGGNAARAHGERAFPRAAGSGDAEDRVDPVFSFSENRPSSSAVIICARVFGSLRRIKIATREHVVDHALQPHALPVLGRVDARNAVVLQLVDLGGHDDPPPPPNTLMCPPSFARKRSSMYLKYSRCSSPDEDDTAMPCTSS